MDVTTELQRRVIRTKNALKELAKNLTPACDTYIKFLALVNKLSISCLRLLVYDTTSDGIQCAHSCRLQTDHSVYLIDKNQLLMFC